MAGTPEIPRAGLPGAAPCAAHPEQFEFQRFDVYRAALEFQALGPGLLPPRGHAALRAQLDRASASVLLNIAEGCGRFARLEKAHFYLIARGSAMECAAVLDALVARGLAGGAKERHARGLLIRIVQMLTRLAQRMRE